VVLPAAGDTVNQLPPVVVAEKDTGAEALRDTVWVIGVVDPAVAEGDHVEGFAVTAGGGAPEAVIVVEVRLKLVGVGSVVVV
jgi:hypothetical protein